MNNSSSTRLQSIDALRGFDMLWIMGGSTIVTALYGIFGGNTLGWCALQMNHVPWDGFHFMDMVFPLFLFIAGVSFPFSLEKRRTSGHTDASIYLHLFKRAFLLILLGFIYNKGLQENSSTPPRFASVLAHIGLAWFFGGIIFMNTKNTAIRVFWVLLLLVGYGLLNALVLSPNATGTNPFVVENNIVTQFDRWFLPGRLYKGDYDPEGLLSLIPAIATALSGMMAGEFLRDGGTATPVRKLILFVSVGIFFIVLALIVNRYIPFNKRLWSSSFAFLNVGISTLLLAAFYGIIDVLHWSKWTFFFRVIGMNSIFIYMSEAFIDYRKVSEMFFGKFSSLFAAPVGELILAIGYLAVCWLLLLFLYRKKIFIKV
jgi:predicted acyltransferase